MGQDEKQLTTQTSDTIAEHGTEACDPEEAKQEDGACIDKEGASPNEGDDSPSDPTGKENVSSAGSDDNSSDSVDIKDTSSKKDDRDAREQKFWGCVTWTVFAAMIVTTTLAMQILFSGVYSVVAVVSYAAIFLSFLAGLYLWLDQKEIPVCNRSLIKKLCVVTLVVLFFGGLGFWGFFFAISESEIIEISIPLVLIILTYSVFVVLASGGVLFCWEVKGAKGARERAMGMAAVASVAGILLTVALAFMSTLDSSDYDVESYGSNEALVDTYQDKPYSGQRRSPLPNYFTN